jgi:hypothetical protein
MSLAFSILLSYVVGFFGQDNQVLVDSFPICKQAVRWQGIQPCLVALSLIHRTTKEGRGEANPLLIFFTYSRKRTRTSVEPESWRWCIRCR